MQNNETQDEISFNIFEGYFVGVDTSAGKFLLEALELNPGFNLTAICPKEKCTCQEPPAKRLSRRYDELIAANKKSIVDSYLKISERVLKMADAFLEEAIPLIDLSGRVTDFKNNGFCYNNWVLSGIATVTETSVVLEVRIKRVNKPDSKEATEEGRARADEFFISNFDKLTTARSMTTRVSKGDYILTLNYERA